MPLKLQRVIRLDSEKAHYLSEGYLEDKPILTRVGIFEYTNDDGSIRRELRLPEEVFAEESLKSYKGKPIIVTHDAGLVTKTNVRENQIGTILTEGYKDGENVRAEIVIHDTDAMKDCGFKELSLGYSLDLDETPGEWNGQPYDAIQRNIIINHLALVQEARAGDNARLNIDGRKNNTIIGGNSMATKKTTRTSRMDDKLSPDELQTAIKEYVEKRNAQAAKTDGEELDPKAKTAPVADTEVKTEEPAVKEDNDEEEKIAPAVATDAEEDPTDIEGATEAIKAREDEDGTLSAEDVKKLFDLIDTLLAEREFNKADGEDTENKPENSVITGDECEDKDLISEDGDDEDKTLVKEEEDKNLDEDDDLIPTKDKTEINTDSIDTRIRKRAKVNTAGVLLNLDGIEDMSLIAAQKRVIKAVKPEMRLDGKSAAFVEGAFNLAYESIKSMKKNSTDIQKRQMFNADSKTAVVRKTGAEQARERMIARQQKKEDK